MYSVPGKTYLTECGVCGYMVEYTHNKIDEIIAQKEDRFNQHKCPVCSARCTLKTGLKLKVYKWGIPYKSVIFKAQSFLVGKTVKYGNINVKSYRNEDDSTEIFDVYDDEEKLVTYQRFCDFGILLMYTRVDHRYIHLLRRGDYTFHQTEFNEYFKDIKRDDVISKDDLMGYLIGYE